MYSSSSSSDSDDGLHRRRQRKVYRPRINSNFVSVFEYNERFRLNSVAVEELVNEIGHLLYHPTNRSHALSVKFQVMITLHWLGNGGQYHGIAMEYRNQLSVEPYIRLLRQ